MGEGCINGRTERRKTSDTHKIFSPEPCGELGIGVSFNIEPFRQKDTPHIFDLRSILKSSLKARGQTS